MNLDSNWKTIAPVTGIAALIIWGIAGQNKIEGAGSLTPPAGAPAPTMPTLQQIGEKVDTLGSGGKSFALRFSTMVQVWNGETGVLGPKQEVTGLLSVVESDGNFCAFGPTRGYAWNKMTSTWVLVSQISGAPRLTKSNGNFCLVWANKAAAWSRHTGTWKTSPAITNPGSVKTANGNFQVNSSTGRQYFWSETTGGWLEVTPTNDFVGTIGP